MIIEFLKNVVRESLLCAWKLPCACSGGGEKQRVHHVLDGQSVHPKKIRRTNGNVFLAYFRSKKTIGIVGVVTR